MKNKIRFLAMMLIGVLLSVNQVWSGSYVLDKASLTTAKSAYQSSDYTQTATDGSKWTLNGYGITVSTYVQLGKATTNYITTPACSGDITNITITCSGSYYLAIWTTDGSLIGSCVQKCSTTGSGAAGTNSFDIPAGYKQVKIVSTRTQNGTSITSSNAATYISNIEVTYGGSTKTVNYSLTNVTGDSDNPDEVDGSEDLDLYFTAEDGYNCPDAITVKVGTTTLAAGTDYTWETADEMGELQIPKAKITGDITITIVGVEAPTGAFHAGETLFFRSNGLGAWDANACVSAEFSNNWNNKNNINMSWLYDVGSTTYKMFYIVVPSTNDYDRVELWRYQPNSCLDDGKKWNSNGHALASERNDKNVIYSAGSGTSQVSWYGTIYNIYLRGSVDGWGGNLATFTDNSNGNFVATVSNAAPTGTIGDAASYEFKLYDSNDQWIQSSNKALNGLKAGSTYNIAASFNIGDRDNMTLTPTLVKASVRFDANGHGTAPSNMTDITPNAKISDPTAPSASGWRFDGWYTAATGGTQWNFSTSTVTESMVLYAHWTQLQSYTVTFKNNGTQTSTQQVVEGGTVSSLPTLAASQAPISGYTFMGWVNHNDAWSGFEAEMTQALITGNEIINADVTYEAVWAKVTNNYKIIRSAAELTAGNYVIDGYDDGDDTEEAMDNTFNGKTFPTEEHGVISTTDNSIIWNVTIKNGQYALKNLSTNTYFNFTSSSSLTLSSTPVYLTISGEVEEEENIYKIDLNNGSRHLEYDFGVFDSYTKAYNSIYFYKQKVNNYFVTPPAQITVTWHIGNETQTATTYDGTAFSDVENVPSVADDAIGDCVNKFMGWATTTITKDEATAEDVDWADETTISNSNKDFYAVFAQAEGTDAQTAKITPTDISGWKSLAYATSYNKTSTDGTTWAIQGVWTNSNNVDNLQMNSTTGRAITTPVFASNITKIEFNAKGQDITIYDASGNEIKSQTLTSTADDYTINMSDVEYNQVKIANKTSGVTNIYSLTITYGGATYSNYATSCPELKYATIHFDANGKTLASGSMPADITNAVVGRATTLPGCSATVTGYTFAGWSATSSGSVITEYTPAAEGQTYTMYAKWTPETVTITWNANGGSVSPTSSSYTYDGASVELPTPTTTLDKKFVGWFTAATGGTQITEIGTTNKPAANVTYFAQWRDIVWTDYLTDCGTPYNITLVDGGTKTGGNTFSTSPAGSAIEGSTVTLTANPNSCYNFTGWNVYKTNESSTKVKVTDNTFTMQEYDVTVDATFTLIDYAISYNLQGGGAPQGSSETYGNVNVGCGNTWTAPIDPVKTGYDFAGWLSGEGETLYKHGQGFVPTKAQTMIAQWTAQTYTITYKDRNDAAFSGTNYDALPKTHTYGTSTTLVNAEPPTGYEFQGWYKDAGCTGTSITEIGANEITADITIYAKILPWGCNSYSFQYGGDDVKENNTSECFTYSGHDDISELANFVIPNAKNYFVGERGWFQNSDLGNSGAKSCVVGMQYLPFEATMSNDARPTIGSNAVGAIGTLRVCDNSNWDNIYVTFRPNGYGLMYGATGTENKVAFTQTSATVWRTAPVELTADMKKTDNSFKYQVGLLKSDNDYTACGHGEAAKFGDMRSYCSTWDNGGWGGNLSGYDAGRWGYFEIWIDNVDKNWCCHFTPMYRLHYDLDGGENANIHDEFRSYAQSGADLNTTVTTEVPVRDGYTFLGWKKGETPIDAGETVAINADNVVITAIWAENYTVTYDLAGYSTSCSSSTVHYCGEEVTVCPAPEDKTGYTFMGWNTDDITGSAADYRPGTTFEMPCNNVVFTADYQADEYDITYLDQNGGAFSGTHGANHPISHTYGTATTLVNPTKTGYNFGGWYLDEPCTGAQVTVLAADGYTADITLYAKWTIQTYTVTFDLNGGQGTAPTALTEVPYNSTISAPDAPADYEDGSGLHTFAGWYKENTCDNAWNFASDVVIGNTTLYAKWSGVTYEDYRTHCCTPLPAPETRDASNIHMTTATLSWNAVSGNNGYQVSADQVNWENVLDGTSYDLTDLTPGTHYTYYVRAKGDNDAYCQYGTAASIGFTTKAALHITYKANGGTGDDVESEVIEEGTSATVAANTFTAPTGMTFNGWNTQAEGDGTAYAVGATINPLNADLTLYAQWIGATFNVTYELDGGTGGCTSTTATYNSEFTICSTIPTKGTNAFTGWSSDVEIGGKSTFQPGETFTMPASNVTLTAQWAESYTVTYVINNVDVIGTSPAGPSYVARGQSTTLPDFEFSCGLYNQFIGWVDATVAKSEEKIACPNLVGEPGDSFTPTGDITLYALFGHDAENLGWVKQTTISSGKYIMATGSTVMTGFGAAQTSTTNNGSCTNVDESSTGVYNPTTVESAIQVQAILGTGGNAGKFALQYGDYYIVPSGEYLNYNVTDVANAYTWKLTDGSQVSDKNCAAGVLQNAGSTTYICQKNSSQVKYKMYLNTQGAANCVYLYKFINEGYYTTSPTCEIPTSVTVTYNKNAVDDVEMCETAVLEFDETLGYPTLAESYTLCAADDVVREGYVLRTWNTAANGSGKDYDPGTVFTKLGNNLNLYAQWDRVYTVTFHDKYGSAEATATEVTQASLGSTINVPAAALDDDCITFVGWTSESTVQNGNPVQPNIVIAAGTATYTPAEDMHLYAIYSKEGSALDFAPATEGVRSFYLANTALTAYATGTIPATSTGRKFSSEATTTNATPIFIDYQTSHVGNYKYTIRTANGYLAPTDGTNLKSQAEPYYWNIVSGSDGGYNITASNSTNNRQISYSDQYFGFYTYLTSVKLVPCAASTFWSNPTCAEFVTITFQTVGDITINWTGSRGTADSYKDLPINTSITQWPTAQYEGWTFAGWSKVDYSNSSKYAGSFAEDTKNGTMQPDQSDGLYANEKATLELIANNNYNMYPIFTKVHESTEFDEAIGGDYLIYFKGEGTRYKDDYTKFDDEYLRVYATGFTGSAYHSTSSCAEAYTFTFVKRTDGNWDIKRGTNYLCNTNDNDIYEQAGLPDYGWTMEKQDNGSYIIHYVGNTDERKYIRVLDLGSGPITNSTFKCYSQDQEHSGMYMPVFIGSCVERQYSSEPSNKPTLEMAGAVYTTSTNGQNVRSATGYTIKGSFLKANTEISLTDALGNAIAGLSIVGSDGKVIKADANGTLASTTAYVVYNPTETTDGITNRKVYISAVDRNEAAIRSAAPSINNIHLRHLPAKFLIAQKVGADWYALPNDMGATMSNPAAAKLLSVNEATGTATIYSDVENIYAYTLLAGKASTANMVFNSQAEGKTGSALRSSDVTEGDNITKMGLYATSTWSSNKKPEYEFAPATEDLKDYTLTSAKQNADLGIADGNWAISGDQTVRFFAIDQQTPVNLTLTGDVALTSATGIEVYGNQTSNLLTISADYTNVAKLRYTYNDGTSDVDVSSSVFRLNYYDFAGQTDYNKADVIAGTPIDVSSLTGEVDQTFSVSLKPTAANTMYNYTLTIAALDASNNVMEEKQITLKGRSLPDQFVIAMKSTNGDSWYALPNDLAISTSEGSSTKAPLLISVDNATAPTKALMAPKNTLYKGYGRYEATKHRNAIRFLRADATNNAWITTSSTSQLYMPAENSDKQQFNLLSSDLSAYTIRQDEDTRTIAMYGGTIGWYDSGSKTVYLLPVDANAEPAVFDIVEWFPTKLLIESSQDITNTSVKVGTDEAVAGTAGTTTYGTNLYEVQTGDLTTKAGQAMSVSYTIETTTYAKVVTVPIILSRGKYATSGSVFGGLDAQSKYQDNDLVVRDGATLTVDATTGTWNKFVNVTIYPTSKVIVPAKASDEKDVTMTTTTMTLFGGTDEIYNGSEYTLTKYGVPQLVLNGKLVHNETTSGLVYDVRLDATQYYNFALPYTSKYELVTDNKGGEDFTFWTKVYDGATRAAGNNGWVWYNWDADPWAINIGTGYMFAAQPYSGQNYIIIRHPMGYDATENADGHRTSTAEATKAAVDVYAYPSKYDNNAGWNYIANPFMANFRKDLGDGSTGTIQTGRLVEHKVNDKWDGHYEWEAGSLSVRYVTLYDNGSDTYEQLPMSTATLAPFTGFFVQMAEGGQIVFDISGRTNSAPARMLGEDELPSEMEIFLHATCQGQKDDAVLFINDNLHRDNAKEFPNEMTKQENANTLNFYTFGGDEVKMYANGMSYEDAQGWSKAGVKVATAGEYTFSVASDQADYIQQVILRDMDSNTEYDLMNNDAKIYLDKGEMNDRFYVKIVFGKHNIGTGVTERYDTSGPEKFILNDHMYIRANGVLFDGVGKRVKY